MWPYVLLGLVLLGATHKSEEIIDCDNLKTVSDIPPEDMLKSMLDALIGLKNIKKQVSDLVNFVKVQKMKKDRNIKCCPISLHMVFSGNPGTGKTVVARILSQYFYRIGLCKNNVFIEADRSCIVRKYIGHTEARMKELFAKAKGGVIFIDEAYALAMSDDCERDFGHEAINTMVKLLEDERDNTIVIVAGYTDKMSMFLKSNPGLSSRFPFRLAFDDYSAKELYQIFCFMAAEYNLTVSGKCENLFFKVLKMLNTSTEEFGNARGVRNILDKILLLQANRVAGLVNPTNKELIEIKPTDFELLLDAPIQTDKVRKIGFEANKKLTTVPAPKKTLRKKVPS